MTQLHDKCIELIEQRCASEEDIIRSVEQHMRKEGHIDPQMAVQKWIALLERRRLVQKLRKQEKLDNADTRRNHVDTLR